MPNVSLTLVISVEALRGSYICPSKQIPQKCHSEHFAMCPSEHDVMCPSEHEGGINLELKEKCSCPTSSETYSRVLNRRRAGNNRRAWKICQKE